MITSFASNTTTADGTEQSLAAVNVQGEFTFFIDTSNMAAGDILFLRAYKIALTGGTKRLLWQTAYYGAQAAPVPIMKQSPTVVNDLTDTNSLQFTMQQTTGTNRAFAWKCVKNDALVPTTSGLTLDVTATGEAGIDWANIGGPTTAQGLTNTTISTSQVVASVTGAVGSVTGNVGGNVTGSVGSVVGAVGSVTGAVGSVTGNVGGNVAGSVGSVTGNVGGNVAGSVGSVTAGVTVTTNNDKTGYRLSATGVNDILRAALTEGYAANGVAPTLEQAIFAIQQGLLEFAISGTTLTVKKIDHTTAAETFTLDSATSPTSRVRAT